MDKFVYLSESKTFVNLDALFTVQAATADQSKREVRVVFANGKETWLTGMDAVELIGALETKVGVTVKGGDTGNAFDFVADFGKK